MNNKTSPPSNQLAWISVVAKYQKSHNWKGIWQLVNSGIPFVLLWYLMYLSLSVSYLLTLALSVLTAGFLVRLFIIQHDCSHGSFFSKRKANDWVGMVCSMLTWAPYRYWQRSHAIHHANAGNLGVRGIGDLYIMTVNEYLQKSKWDRFKYRLYRNPIILFGFVPVLLFVVLYRFPTEDSPAMKPAESSMYWTNLALFLFYGGLALLIGWKALLLIFAPVIFLATSVGFWFFYIQHQFEDTYFADPDNWDYTDAALQGSSYYKLPKILQWFSGNIGFHHIHHLSPRIPNYFLQKCHDENPMFQNPVVLTLGSSLKTIPLALWDEEQRKLISFGNFKQHYGTALS